MWREVGSLGIECHADVAGSVVFHDIQQGVGEPVNGRSINSLAGDDRVAEKGKVGAVDECHTVEEKKLMHYGESLRCSV